MRSMPRPGPAIFADPKTVDPRTVQWRWRTKVYPDTLAVRSIGDPWPTYRDLAIDTRVEVARWDVCGIATYAAYAAIGPDEKLLTACDGVVFHRHVEQEFDEHTGTVKAWLGSDCDAQTSEYRDIFMRVAKDTVRGVVACWANEHPPEYRDWRDVFLGHVVNLGVWIVGQQLPTGMGDGCTDLRLFTPAAGF